MHEATYGREASHFLEVMMSEIVQRAGRQAGQVFQVSAYVVPDETLAKMPSRTAAEMRIIMIGGTALPGLAHCCA